jgi:hypothetical protein
MTSQWGEIQATSASTLYQQITDDAGGANVYVGQWVQSTTGDKGKEATALNDRSAQDTDQTDTTPSAYQAAVALGPTHANGRRLVSVIINSGFATAAGAIYPTSQTNIGTGFAQFLLLPSGQYTNSGGSNNPWCAVYVGPAPGYATAGGGSGAANGAGIGFVRLVQ